MRPDAITPYAAIACGACLTVLSATGLLEPGATNDAGAAAALKAGIVFGLLSVVVGLLQDANRKPHRECLGHDR